MRGDERRRWARAAAESHGGVISRARLRAAGITHDDVRNEVEAGRWRLLGHQTVAVHCGVLGAEALRWRAIWETGSMIAALDGVTALLAAGLTGFVDDAIHLSVKHSHTIRPLDGVRIHKVIRRQPAEVLAAGIPRVRPAVAAIRAAGWAVSDQQAALLLVMPIQQGLVLPGHLVEACGLVLGRRRRSFIKGVVGDICLGVQALGELDFARMCRSRGLPEPTRQVTRRGLAGRAYLDVYWDDHDLAVEIDGSQHRQGLAVTRDNLRTNDVVLAGDRLLRVDLLGLRLEADLFFAQVAAGLGLPRPVRGNSSLHAAS